MGKKIFRSGEGKGIRGEKGEKNWGKKTEGEKQRKGRGKKKTIGDRENGTAVAHICLEPSAQEPNALPVAYCDSLASL